MFISKLSNRYNTMTTLLLKLLTLVTLINAISTDELPYKITETNNHGIIFEDLGNVNFFDSNWEILTSFTLPNITEALSNIKLALSKINNICISINQTDYTINCLKMLSTQQNYVNGLEKEEVSIENAYFGKIRNRRELINGVGRFSNFLFGTMDDRDAQRIYSRLENLETNEENNFHLIKQQISVVKSSFDKLKQPILENEQKILEIQNYTNKLLELENDLSNKVSGLGNLELLWQEIVTINTNLLFKILDIQHEQQVALAILASLRVHKLHPLILSSKEVSELLVSVNEKAHRLNTYLNQFHLDQIQTVDFFPFNNKILIKISVPLPSEENYILNKIYLLPIVYNNTTMIINQKADYIALSPNIINYQYLTQEEIKNCKSIILNQRSSVKLCKKLSVTFSKPDCISAILTNNTVDYTSLCSYTKINPIKNKFTKLLHPNSWIYIINPKQDFILNCPKYNKVIPLSNTGVITLFQKCFLGTHDFTLPLAGQIFSSKPTLQSNKLWLNHSDKVNDTIFLRENSTPIQLQMSKTNTHNNDFNEINSDLDKLLTNVNTAEKKRLELRDKISRLSNTSYIGISIIAFIGTISALIGIKVVYRLVSSILSKKQTVTLLTTPEILTSPQPSKNTKIKPKLFQT